MWKIAWTGSFLIRSELNFLLFSSPKLEYPKEVNQTFDFEQRREIIQSLILKNVSHNINFEISFHNFSVFLRFCGLKRTYMYYEHVQTDFFNFKSPYQKWECPPIDVFFRGGINRFIFTAAILKKTKKISSILIHNE